MKIRYKNYLLVALMSLIFFYLSGERLVWILISIGLLSPLIVVLTSIKRKNSFLSVDFWFFGSLFLWSAMYPMDYLLGLEKPTEALFQTTIIYAVANFTCTFFFVFMKKIVLRYNKDSETTITDLGYSFKFETGMVLVLLGLALLVYRVQSLGGIGALGIENRIANFQKDGSSNGLSFPWQTILSVGLLITAGTVKKLNYFIGFVIALAIFLIFGFGARGDVLFVCLPAILLVLSKKRIITSPYKKTLILFFILLVMSPLFTNLRGSILFQKPLSSYEKWEWAYNRGETGGAFRVTMDVVGREHSTEWPINTYVLEGFSFLPSSLFELLFGQTKFSSDKFFVENYYPWQAQHGMSFGFSPVAGVRRVIIGFPHAANWYTLFGITRFTFSLAPNMPNPTSAFEILRGSVKYGLESIKFMLFNWYSVAS